MEGPAALCRCLFHFFSTSYTSKHSNNVSLSVVAPRAALYSALKPLYRRLEKRRTRRHYT